MKIRYSICAVLVIALITISYGGVEAKKYNMTYLYGSGNYISMINDTNNVLDEVSPSYFDLDTSGNLLVNTIDYNLIRTMHSEGRKVVPFFSNHWDREVGRLALSNREKVTTEIANAVIKYDLDGVNVDIENVTEKDKEAYTNLVKLLREKLPESKSVVVSVAANPNNWTTGWHGSYDYTNLAKYADYLMIMAYDEHYEGGDAGAVAGIEFVEKSIQYALERVEKDKIVLGIPLYGRYWKDSTSTGGGKALSLEKVSELVRTCNGKITFDEKSKSPKAEIFVSAVGTRPKINGKTLQPGSYTIWYENEDSIRAKLELINKYDIKGAGTWRLGMEEKSIWDVFKEYLSKDNKIFDDVEDGYWAEQAIKYMKDKKWITGKAENIYKPEMPITRAEVATIICRVLNLEGESENKYSDTRGHWAEKYINAITKLEIVEGYETNEFNPDKYITRAEIAKILSKLATEKAAIEEYPNYKDVSKNYWAYEYIKILSEQQIINGYTDGTFKPQKEVTRAEIAKMIYEIYK